MQLPFSPSSAPLMPKAWAHMQHSTHRQPSLQHPPLLQVLLLDEITVDLDVLGRADLMRFLAEECESRGATIVYATHIFDGLEVWPTHVACVARGEAWHMAAGSAAMKRCQRRLDRCAAVAECPGAGGCSTGVLARNASAVGGTLPATMLIVGVLLQTGARRAASLSGSAPAIMRHHQVSSP